MEEKKEVTMERKVRSAKKVRKTTPRKVNKVEKTNNDEIKNEVKENKVVRKRPYGKRKVQPKEEQPASNLKIIPLGGLLEVGKNVTVFEYENDMIVVDCGLSFPEDDMLGIDLVIPDITYIKQNQDRLKGMIITHGHEDHIGSVPYFLKEVNTPIYGTKLTLGLIKNKLEEHKLLRSTKLKVVNQGEKISLGKMKVEFIRSCHSIPDAVALAIHTPIGTVIHTGDFKVDYTPNNASIIKNTVSVIGCKLKIFKVVLSYTSSGQLCMQVCKYMVWEIERTANR